MTHHQCQNVCDWKTTERDQPSEAQLSLPTCTHRTSGKPSFRLWPSRFRKVARPPSDLLNCTQNLNKAKAFFVQAFLPVNIGRHCFSWICSTKIFLLITGFMIFTRTFASKKRNFAFGNPVFRNSSSSRRIPLPHFPNIAWMLLGRSLPTIWWLVQGDSSLESLHVGLLFSNI